MENILDKVRQYLATTPSSKLSQVWEELKHFNEVGPYIDDVIAPPTLIILNPMGLSNEEPTTEIQNDAKFAKPYSHSKSSINLCRAA